VRNQLVQKSWVKMAATVAKWPPWSPTEVLEANLGPLMWTHPHLSMKLNLGKRTKK